VRMNRRQFVQRGAAGMAAAAGLSAPQQGAAAPIPEKVVVLTFDDAVRSHRTFVGPLLKELGFGATFFVTHRWMADREHFMSWQEIAELHQIGFEIGNHSWTHSSFAVPKHAARLAGELGLVENELKKVGVPRPASFGYCSNGFGPEAIARLRSLGYRFARRGMQPEVAYGKMEVGTPLDPTRHHPLLIPSTSDAYPDWTFDHFKRVAARAEAGRIVVMQFHGVPDLAHPWVHTPPEQFRQYMAYLKEGGFRVIALRDVAPYLEGLPPPADPLLTARYPDLEGDKLVLPPEVVATRADLAFWLPTMLRDHHYELAEAAAVCALPQEEVRRKAEALGVAAEPGKNPVGKRARVLPYPGGRHPRIGFLEGAIDPQRGTKASVFLPWDPAEYVVVDLPEAVFSNLGLLFLAHTHIPTVWDDQNMLLDNVDWTRKGEDALEYRRTLPGPEGARVEFGASVRGEERGAAMELWLRNGSDRPLTGLRTQICVMLKGAPEFAALTNENKLFRSPVAAVRSSREGPLGARFVLTTWEKTGRAWGNERCPCLHADPVLPDCPAGETVRVRGRLRFYEGREIEREMERLTTEREGAPIDQ
jgi:peptidoglycan/xylan/chitin deacetylase (PgdA/CDA1 family)